MCSTELSVKHSVGEPIPEFCQAPEEGTKIPSVAGGQNSGDILPDQPAGPISCSNGKIGEEEVASRVSQPGSKAGNAERLARGSSNEKVNCVIGPFLKAGHVAAVGDAGIVMRQDSARERLDLGEP
jgi:hypothetical protein